MTEKFINLKDNIVQVTPFVNADAEYCELKELIEAVEGNTGETLVCSIEGAVHALQDGEYLAKVDASQETIEELFIIISEQA